VKEGIYQGIWFPPSRGRDPTRPYVFINMVASVDGKTAVEGKASSLGSAADRSVMRTLRSRADAVMVGGGTLRAEKLSLSLEADEPGPRPLAVILTSTGDVPLESNLIRDRRQRLLVLVSERVEEGVERHLGCLAEVRRMPTAASGLIDLAKALKIMHTEYGIDVLLCEGGPTLNHALISANLTDELFVTLAPTLVGEAIPKAPTFLNGSLEEPRRLRLISAHPARDELFLRYALDTDTTPKA
jgi:2,5-diamino-6-(ribosylamino)-4(3H)-pyrimidinone 5'-phosphate reductase